MPLNSDRLHEGDLDSALSYLADTRDSHLCVNHHMSRVDEGPRTGRMNAFVTSTTKHKPNLFGDSGHAKLVPNDDFSLECVHRSVHLLIRSDGRPEGK